MNCNNCGTENPEGAVYCKECGKRLDGMVACPKCGNLNPDDAVYCVSCGKRIDGMTVCSCGEVYSGNFCPKCGAKNSMKPSKTEAGQAEATPLWQSALKLGGGITAMVMVFVSLLFVFFIGFIATTHGSMSGVSLGLSMEDSTLSIFDLFGKNFKDVKEVLEGMDEYQAIYPTSLYLTATLELIVAVGVLVAVSVLAVLSVVFFVCKMCGKRSPDYVRVSIATFFTYMLGAVLLLVLEQIKFNLKMSSSSLTSSASGSASLAIGLNKVTIAGVILGAVLLAVFAGLHIAANGSKLFRKSRGIPLIFAFTASVFAVIAFSLAASAALKLDFKTIETIAFETSVIGTTTLRGTFSSSFMWALQLIIPKYEYGFALESPDSLLALGAVTQLVQFGLLTCLAILIVFRLADVVKGNNASRLASSILVFLFAVAHLVLTIVFGNKFIELAEAVNTELVLTSVIVILVFAAVNLALSAVQLSIKKFLSEKPEEN